MEKKIIVPSTTITRDMRSMTAQVGNIYETVAIISKRANQISVDMKKELEKKLSDFSSYTDNMEEVQENRERIEVSRHYERLPKATLQAISEFENNRTYYRNPLLSKDDEIA